MLSPTSGLASRTRSARAPGPTHPTYAAVFLHDRSHECCENRERQFAVGEQNRGLAGAVANEQGLASAMSFTHGMHRCRAAQGCLTSATLRYPSVVASGSRHRANRSGLRTDQFSDRPPRSGARHASTSTSFQPPCHRGCPPHRRRVPGSSSPSPKIGSNGRRGRRRSATGRLRTVRHGPGHTGRGPAGHD